MQREWKVGLDTLREKCGSGSSLKEFRRLVSKIIDDDAQHDHMPDYTYAFDENLLIVRPKKDNSASALPLQFGALRINPDCYDRARQCAPGWDIHSLEREWRSWVLDKAISVKDADAHFLAFCKKRGPLR